MAKIALKRPEVAQKYECTLTDDLVIHADGYNGRISNVNLSGAAHLVRSKTGYLVEKEGADQSDHSSQQ